MNKFVRIENDIGDAVLKVMKYITETTGIEPTQEEIAETLKSYFILNEVCNQIKYQLKKPNRRKEQDAVNITGPFWTLNLMSGPGKNVLAKAGVFHKSIQEAIQATRNLIKENTGVEPSDVIIAKGLQSSFILSEIKNQIDYQRKKLKKQNER